MPYSPDNNTIEEPQLPKSKLGKAAGKKKRKGSPSGKTDEEKKTIDSNQTIEQPEPKSKRAQMEAPISISKPTRKPAEPAILKVEKVKS